MSQWHREMEGQLRRQGPLKGRYEIESPLGAGAYGMILQARDQRDNQRVAIKVIPQAAAERSDTAVGRFRREMKVIRSLDHPNIVAMHDWGHTGEGLLFMVLEFIEGQTLDEVVRHRPMTREVGVDTGRQIALAVDAAHRQGVIHRDLKPANIMLVPRGNAEGYQVKVLDFGMAKMLGSVGDEGVIDLTREGMAVGTPRYIAPEQARGKEVGPTSDLYAVGLLLYEIFTGVQAVEADTVRGAVNAHVSSHPLELRALEEVPVGIRSIIVKAVEKTPERRFQKGRELAAALQDPDEWARRHAKQVGGGGLGPALGDMTGDFPGASSQGKQEGRRRGDRAQRSRKVDAKRGGEPLQLDESVKERAQEERRRSGAWREEATGETRPQRSKGRWFRPPRGVSEWSEALLSGFALVLAFLCMGAQFSDLEWGARLVVAGGAPILAMGLALSRDSGAWEMTLGRLGWVIGLPVVVVAHGLGPGEMAVELMRNPSWFLTPLDGLPGVAWLGEGVDWMGRHWAALVLTVFEAPTP